jgi:ADP-heptose:LPS heptosyltransferase
MLFALDSIVLTVNIKNQQNAVLFIRLDLIGDFIAWTGAALELSKYYHTQKRILLVNEVLYDLSCKLGYWDEIWPVNRNKFGSNPIYRLRILYKVRRYGFNIVINPRREFRITDSIVRISNAPQRIGANGGETFRELRWETKISNRWYTKIINLTPRFESSVFQHGYLFCKGMGINLENLPIAFIPPHVDEEVSEFDLRLSDYYIIFVGASDSIRMWPPEMFAEIARRIWMQFKMQGVICGGPSDIITSEKVLTLSCTGSLINFTGKTNLLQLIGIIRHAKLCISNETGAIHIAVATACPSICILGGGDFGYFMPYPIMPENINYSQPIAIYKTMDCYRCTWDCIYPITKNQCAPCISEISVDDVWGEILNSYTLST